MSKVGPQIPKIRVQSGWMDGQKSSGSYNLINLARLYTQPVPIRCCNQPTRAAPLSFFIVTFQMLSCRREQRLLWFTQSRTMSSCKMSPSVPRIPMASGLCGRVVEAGWNSGRSSEKRRG